MTAAGNHTIRIILLVLAAITISTAGGLYFTAPGPSQTVRNFANDYNNHEWSNVAKYASSDTGHYLEKQRTWRCHR